MCQKNKVKAGKVSQQAKASAARCEEPSSMFCSLTCRCVSHDMHSCAHTHTHKAKDENVLYIIIPTKHITTWYSLFHQCKIGSIFESQLMLSENLIRQNT